MKRQIALSLALTSLMTASAAFAAPAILNNGPRATHQHEHQLQQQKVEDHVAANGSERTIDRLHKQMGDEARVADNGSERTIDRLHKQMGDEARVAENGSDRTIDRLHKQMGDEARVAENGSEHSVDRLHDNMVAESGGDTVFDAHLKV
ncbi:phage infection protein [Pseudomonas sp. LA21]|uniref:phage infection protein n=1 Tax=unclassified Pseudomonas TaxID=196821 RepID=UPI001A9E64CE|nr:MULTISPECIES: phage infection protein [unclassified Pseudomonas]MCJ1883693.1 phage infection protein [Pseudomonas sp. LA21]